MANRIRSAEKEEFWRLVLLEFESFHGTVREYCRREGLAENSFYGWRREIGRRDAAVNSGTSQLIPVKVVEAEPSRVEANDRMEILTLGGLALRLQSSFPVERLSDVLSVVLEAESDVRRCQASSLRLASFSPPLRPI
jgi:hypothetical protein